MNAFHIDTVGQINVVNGVLYKIVGGQNLVGLYHLIQSHIEAILFLEKVAGRNRIAVFVDRSSLISYFMNLAAASVMCLFSSHSFCDVS